MDRVLRKIEPGSIILLHDGLLDRSKTAQALPLLLNGLKKKGYQVIPLTEMLEMEQSEFDSLAQEPFYTLINERKKVL